MKNMPDDGVFVHPQGLCESGTVGARTRVWAFAHVLPGARVGTGCNICDHVFIENDVEIGDDVTIKCGVQVWDGTRIGNRVFIGPNATFTNDRFPRSKQYPEKFLPTIVEDDVSIGANATILPGVRIGRGAMIGAGAVVVRNVPAHFTVVGNPGTVARFHETDQAADDRTAPTKALAAQPGARVPLNVRGSWIERLPNFVDARGSLTPLEAGRGLPFAPARVFLIQGVPEGHHRGEHAHYRCEQFLVASGGGISVALDDGRNRCVVRLEDSSVGLYMAPLVWGVQFKFDLNCVLMVAASHPYEPDDYIRDYSAFLQITEKAETP